MTNWKEAAQGAAAAIGAVAFLVGLWLVLMLATGR